MADETDTADAIVAEILDRTGGDVRLALPLGIGKAITIVNALTRAVAARPETRLSILTALTLERPTPSAGMERRFLEPAADRLFGDAPALDYARMLRDGALPANIEVSEFFMQAGAWLSVPAAQRRYIAGNYTHALDFLRDWRPNVIAQLVAEFPDGDLSLSGNTDITADLLKDRDAGTQDFLFAAEINRHLPAMPGPEARLPRGTADLLLTGTPEYRPFSIPKRPVGAADHAIGLHVSRLIRDGGTIQIGIGTIGDAVAHALMLRHEGRVPAIHRAAPFAADSFGEDAPFAAGLYAVTEMLVDGLVHLLEAGIVRREVDGAAIHAGFFADCRAFYERLRAMPPDRLELIRMVSVTFTNQLYGDEAAKRASRVEARFVNAAMKATLLGGIISDITLAGKEVSGIGGQFNFVEQAFALDGARSVIALPATRMRRGRVTSNILWQHPHESVPRAYRDIVVTEYGIADLRGRPDEEVVMEMLRVADSRFQEDLLNRAKAAGKVAADARLPDGWRHNTPGAVEDWLAPFDLPDFPFGTEFDATDRRLLPALDWLSQRQGSAVALARLALAGLVRGGGTAAEEKCVERMALAAPKGARERLGALVLRGALAATRRR